MPNAFFEVAVEMPSKTSQPALYEKMRSRPTLVAPPRQLDEAVHDVSPIHSLVGLLSPGRTVRLPVGYLLLATGLTILLVVVAYAIGHGSGKRLARLELAERFAGNAINPADDLRTDDPLASLVPESPGRALVNSAQARPTGASSARQTGWPSSWGPVVPKNDPRKKGLSYYVLAETNETGAVKLAEFCRNNGLETYVIPGKNDRTRRVIAFPGFDLSLVSRTAPEVTALRERIYQIGDKWKSLKSSNGNLRDAYLPQ